MRLCYILSIQYFIPCCRFIVCTLMFMSKQTPNQNKRDRRRTKGGNEEGQNKDMLSQIACNSHVHSQTKQSLLMSATSLFRTCFVSRFTLSHCLVQRRMCRGKESLGEQRWKVPAGLWSCPPTGWRFPIAHLQFITIYNCVQ